MTAWLAGPALAKIYSVDEHGEPLRIDEAAGPDAQTTSQSDRNRRATVRALQSATFTFARDRPRLIALYTAMTKRVATAFEHAEATREHSLLEASKGHGESALIARKELAEHRRKVKEVAAMEAMADAKRGGGGGKRAAGPTEAWGGNGESRPKSPMEGKKPWLHV